MDEGFLDRALSIAHALETLDNSFATEAAQALIQAVSEIQHLEIKASHRTVIGQATGILMQREQVGSTTAFMTLVSLSSHSNRKLYDVACEMTTAVDASAALRAVEGSHRSVS